MSIVDRAPSPTPPRGGQPARHPVLRLAIFAVVVVLTLTAAAALPVLLLG